ncbi:MAG: hypothetical protein ABSA67_02735 [Candidatus Brocadiia bacterium]
MTGEPISEASAGWSRRNVAGVAIALIGFGLVVFAVAWFINLALQVLPVLLPGLEQNSNKPLLLMLCGNAFFRLFLGLWLIAHHRKISTRLFRAAAGAPVAERRAALAFGIKAYAVYMAASAASWLVLAASNGIGQALRLAGSRDRAMLWYMVPSCLMYLAEIVACLYFLKRPGWLVSFAYPEGEPDEDA